MRFVLAAVRELVPAQELAQLRMKTKCMPIEIPKTKDPPIKIALQELAIIARNEVEFQDISVISQEHRVEALTDQASAHLSHLPLVKDDMIPDIMQANPIASRVGPDKKANLNLLLAFQRLN